MYYCNTTTPKFLYIDIPKTASRSTLLTLRKNFDGDIFRPPLSHNPDPTEGYDDYFKFCTVRHPYDRMCSLWWHTCKRGLDKWNYISDMGANENTLLNFLKVYKARRESVDISTYWASWPRETGNWDSIHIAPQNLYAENINFDCILRYETLQEDFNKLPFMTAPIELPVMNTTLVPSRNHREGFILRPPTEEMLNDETKEFIYNMSKEEFDMFNYMS